MSLLRQAAAKWSRVINMARQIRVAPPIFSISPKLFSTDSAEPSQGPSIDQFLNPPRGLIYGRITSITKYTTKNDIINMLDESDLSPDKLKVEYNRSYLPLSMMVEFSSPSAYDSAIKAINRKGRLFTLARTDRAQWDAIAPYDGKAILLQGIPSTALPDDVERFLSGCQYDSSSISMPPRSTLRGPVKTVLVRFSSQTLAAHAYITKNRGFCLNNQISVKVLH
ncbi:uncharacterized protein [Primulina eburnea]|uniref:uncharacterized protein n=1 Tax=Primulina eburnea TaxID=1245227 RepID=UPI003C6C3E74